MDSTTLTAVAQEATELIDRGRHALVSAIREAHASGMSQREIAAAVGRSQPEVNRLLRFHGTGPNGIRLRKQLPRVKQILRDADLSNARVFGSTARGEESDTSDIDLLVTAGHPLGLIEQARLSQALTDIVGVEVDLVFDHALRQDLKPRVLSEAIPL